MSKKHFEAAAKEIRGMYVAADAIQHINPESAINLRARAQGAEDVWVNIASQLNDRFDSVRFRQACRP